MAVYTHVSDDVLRDFLAAYDLGELRSFKGIAEGVENSNYFLQTDAGRYILTLYEKRVEEKDLPFFLSLMSHLSERDFPSPTPIADREGRVQSILEGRPAALLQFLEGVSIHRPAAKHCEQVGKALARLHQACEDFSPSRANGLGISSWRGLLRTCEKRLSAYPHDIGEEVNATMESIEQNWQDDLPTGIIHADLFPNNVLFRGDVLEGVIDFYFACRDSLAYDIAVCVNAWCFDPDTYAFLPDNARALLSGYQGVRPLLENELDALSTLCHGAAMRFLLTRLHDWLYHVEGSLVSPLDPMEYLAKLRFHGKAESIKEYGLDL